MGVFLRQHTGIVLLSAVLHGLVVGLLIYAERFTGRTPVARQIAIEATVVDESVIQREIERLERLEQEELRRRQEQERVAREQVEAAKRELETEQQRLEVARREQQEEQKRREEEARQAQLRIADLREEEKRLAVEEEKRRQEAERQLRLEEERLAKLREQDEQRRQREEEEAVRQAALEAELQQALAAEDERRQAEEAGLLDEYIRLIENRIQQNWIRPASAAQGLECVVNVTQIPSGDVIDVRVGRCNGDEAVVRSIEAAVLRASPLPRPQTPALFERSLQVVFHPEE